MNAIEKRARQLLEDMHLLRNEEVKLEVLIAALTPPEGFVMVPVEPTEAMVKAVYPLHYFTYLGPELRENWRRMIDARPEIPNVND